MKTTLLFASALLAFSVAAPAMSMESAGTSFRVGLTIVPQLPDLVGSSRPDDWSPRLAQAEVIVHGFDIQGWVNFDDSQKQAVVVLSNGKVVDQQPILPGYDFDRLARCEGPNGRQAVAVVEDTHDHKRHRPIAKPRASNAWWVSEQGALERVADIGVLRCEIAVDPTTADY